MRENSATDQPTSTDAGTQVSLPPGADPEHTDNWETDGGVTSRLVWSVPDPLLKRASECDLRIVASQRLDGSIVTDANDQPLIYLDGSDYTLDQARLLAHALLAAANLAYVWTGATTTAEAVN